MKAVVQERCGGSESLRLTDLPLPEPGAGEVRVRVLACAVKLSDWEYLTGYPPYARLVGGLRRPMQPVLGSDIVGRVDELGPGVDGVAPGERVTGDFVMNPRSARATATLRSRAYGETSVCGRPLSLLASLVPLAVGQTSLAPQGRGRRPIVRPTSGSATA